MKNLTHFLGLIVLLWYVGNAKAQELELDDMQQYIAQFSYLAGMCQVFHEMKDHADSVDISNDIVFVASFLVTQAQAVSVSVPELAKICEDKMDMYELLIGD